MSETTNPKLMRVFELIETDELDKARTLLDSYLETEKNDPDAWWLYAHAVTEPIEAQNALRNLLRIDPDYPGAKSLLNETEQMLTPKQDSGITRLAPRSIPSDDDDENRPPDFLDSLDDDDDDLFGDDAFDDFDEDDEDIEEAETPQRSRGLLFMLVVAAVVIVLVGAAALLANQLGNRSDTVATPTTSGVVVQATDTPTSPSNTPEPAASAEVINGGDFVGIYAALADFEVVADSAGIETTSLGQTFLISICNDPDLGLVNTALNAMAVIAQQVALVADQAEYIGAKIVDCSQGNLVLRSLGVTTADAESFANGDFTVTELRSKLKPIS